MIIHLDPPVTELPKAQQLTMNTQCKTRDDVTWFMGWAIRELRGDLEAETARLRTLIEGGRNNG